jgi:hypothetical protein
MRHLLALLLILNVSLIKAGEPADLMRTVKTFKGTAPITAKVNLNSWSEKTLRKKPVVMHGSISIGVAQNGQGLQTFLESKSLEQTAKESQHPSSDLNTETSIRWLLKDLDYGRIHHLLDQEEILQGLFADSKFTEEKAGTWKGHVVRIFEFSYKPRLSPEESFRLHHSEGHLVLRANADGLPLQSEINETFEGKTSRMFGRYFGTKRTETSYRVVSDHLIVSERTVEDYLSQEDGSIVTKTKQFYSVVAE